jgi:hypothetical protein
MAVYVVPPDSGVITTVFRGAREERTDLALHRMALDHNPLRKTINRDGEVALY